MDANVRSFIAGTFSSVWSLELLLLLKAAPDRAFTAAELVTMLRASDAVIASSGRALVAAGLVVEEASDRLRYRPVSEDYEALVARTAEAYRRRPDAVRRLIVAGGASELHAFSDAFRLRKDEP